MQISDTVGWQGRDYGLDGIDGGRLFDPATLGLPLRMISTACWRGHICRYDVRDDRLVLTGLAIGSDDPPAEVLGAPRVGQHFGETRYGPVEEAVPFTGAMLITAGFLSELMTRAGSHPAWKYEHVAELTFDAGRLTAHQDRSAAMAAIRATDPSLRLDPDDERRVLGLLAAALDRRYRSPHR